MYLTQWNKILFWFLYLYEGYVEDMKQLLFTLTKPEMAEVYSRYSAKAPEPLSAQFNDRVDKQSAVKTYKEKCGKRNNIQLFPTGTFSSCFRCCFVLIYARQMTTAYWQISERRPCFLHMFIQISLGGDC